MGYPFKNTVRWLNTVRCNLLNINMPYNIQQLQHIFHPTFKKVNEKYKKYCNAVMLYMNVLNINVLYLTVYIYFNVIYCNTVRNLIIKHL